MSNGLKTFFTELADVYRSASGSEEKIVANTLPTLFEELLANGGGSDLIAYVTFMSEDGTTHLFDMPVLKGDDCKDPINHGDIETPTKESNNYYNYSYSGWSSTSSGSVSTSILSNIQEDKIVYACFESSTRYYQVRTFSDGLVVHTQQVTYGSNATPPDIKKDGYKVGGYDGSYENITADTDIHIIWVVDSNVIEDDWDVISQYAVNGEASNHYAVGKTKDLVITYSDGTSETITMRVAHLNPTDEFYNDDKTKNPGIVFIADNLLKNDYSLYNSSNYSSQQIIYKDTDLYTLLNGDFIAYLPSELQNVLVDVVKKNDQYGMWTNDRKGKVWIPSLLELWNYKIPYEANVTVNCEGGKAYDEYSRDTSKRMYKKLGGTTNEDFFFRTTKNKSTGSNYYNMKTYCNGTSTTPVHNEYINNTTERGVLIGFCL